MRLALVCCATALLAAACGGGGGGGGTTDLNAQRTAFVQGANAICRDLAAQKNGDTSTDPATAFDHSLGFFRDAVGKLDKLTVPAPEQAQYQTMMTHLHNNLSFLEKNKNLLIALTIHIRLDPQDTKALNRFEKFIKPFDADAAAARNAAQALSLNACVAGLSPAGG